MTYDIANNAITAIFKNLDDMDAGVEIYRRPKREGRTEEYERWFCRITIKNSNGEISVSSAGPTFRQTVAMAYFNLGTNAVVSPLGQPL